MLKRIALFILASLAFGEKTFAQFNPETETLSKKFFADEPLRDWKIQTPAFLKKEGFTNYAEMMAFLQSKIKQRKELISMEMIGKSRQGKTIPMVLISNPKIQEKKVRVWLQGGLHGDEPAGTESLLFLIGRFAEGEDLHYLLNRIEIAVVPMANIDGYEKQSRENDTGKDLNRDQTSLREPETIALKKAWARFAPEVSLDLHEYRPYRKDFSRFGRAGITSRYDVMFLYSGNLNVPEELRRFTREKFVEPAKKSLQSDTCHFLVNDYHSTQKYGGEVHFNLGSVHARSSASNWALGNCVSTLLEVRGVGIGRKSFRRRTMAGWNTALSYLQSAYSNGFSIKTLLAASHQDSKPVVVLSERKERKDSLLVIDLDTENEISIPVVIHDALQSYPTLSRDRPVAYLLAGTEKKAAEKLRILGIQVDSTSASIELEVETYLVPGWGNETMDEDDLQSEDDETKKALQNGQVKKITRSFSAGTFVIPMQQDKGNLVCELLEPENPNGFLAMKVIRFSGKDKHHDYPVYRCMKPLGK
jgi:hypothetical protein